MTGLVEVQQNQWTYQSVKTKTLDSLPVTLSFSYKGLHTAYSVPYHIFHQIQYCRTTPTPPPTKKTPTLSIISIYFIILNGTYTLTIFLHYAYYFRLSFHLFYYLIVIVCLYPYSIYTVLLYFIPCFCWSILIHDQIILFYQLQISWLSSYLFPCWRIFRCKLFIFL